MLTASERTATLQSVILTAVDAGAKRLRCACPGIVQSFDHEKQTVTVKLAIKEILSIEGVETETEIPLLVDVPVVMPRAGGYSLLMVPNAGDECLVVFSDMCIDAWYQSGGIQSQAERRRHDLSDAFAILGCWSQVRKPSFPQSGIRLQNDEGMAYVAIDNTGVHFLNADFDIKDLYTNENGVAVGMQSTATEDEKKFEVAPDHTAHLYGGMVVSDSSIFSAPVTFQDDIDFSGIDSGWQEVTLSNCTEYSSDWPVYVRKFKDMVYFRGGVKLDSALASGSAGSATGVVTILTLPSSFAPTYEMAFPVIVERQNGYLFCTISTDGTVKLYNRSGNALGTNALIPLSMSFLRQ